MELPLRGGVFCTQGVTLLYGPSVCTRLVQMDMLRNQARPPSPRPGLGTLWVIGGALAGPACLWPVPMDGVPDPQPLTRHEPHYMPWGVLRVGPMGHPPDLVLPWAAALRSQAYPALWLPLWRGRYGHWGVRLTSLLRLCAGVPLWPVCSLRLWRLPMPPNPSPASRGGGVPIVPPCFRPSLVVCCFLGARGGASRD